MSLVIQHLRELDAQLLDTLVALDAEIFPDRPFSRAGLERELTGRRNLSVLLAVDGDEVCGYKVGFEHSPEIFHSFIGGVRPAWRRRGIARALMAEQHHLLRKLGYTRVRTHTTNASRNMLLLDIESGFDVVGVQFKAGADVLVIVLEKPLVD